MHVKKIALLAWDVDLANPCTDFFDKAFQQFLNVDSLCNLLKKPPLPGLVIGK
jgi:hypothetical protein